MTLQTSINAEQIMFYSSYFCSFLQKKQLSATLTDSTVLMFETGINVKQARARFLKTDSQS